MKESLLQLKLKSRFYLVLALAAWLGFMGLADYKAAVALYNRQQYREAIKELQPDISRNPDWEFGHRMVGLCYFFMKDYEKAVVALEKAISLKTKEPSVFLGLAEADYCLEKTDKALSALEQGKSLYQKRAELYNYHRVKGYILGKQGKYSECIDEILQAMQQQTGSAQDWLVLGIGYLKSGQNDKASQALSTALKLDGNLNTAQIYLDALQVLDGSKALKEKNFSRAQGIFKEALGKNPNDPALRFNLALAEIGLKNWAAAEEALKLIENNYSSNYRYNFYRGNVLENLGKNRDAELYYTKALTLQNTPEIKEALQRIKQKMGFK